MAFVGADIGFVGAAYEAPMLLQDAQRCINFFVEVDDDPKAKMPVALLGSPGLNPILSTQTGPVRGAWVLPGGLTALFVTGNTAYLASVTVGATQNSLAMFSINVIGTLLTNNGRVVIRDNGVLFNGAGGYAVLVDGTYGYYYRLAGPGTITFTGGVVSGSPTLTPAGLINPYVVVGSFVTDGSAALPAGTFIESMDFNASTYTLSANATATVPSETFTVQAAQWGQITDPAFLGASRVAFIEGWLLFNQPATRTFFTNAPVPYTLAFAGAFYALKDSSTDNLVTLMENNREAWLIGERTSEVWYNQGLTNFAFTRLPGIGPQVGCAAQHSICRLGPNLAWLARIGESGENAFVMTNQYSFERISNHGVEKALSSYPLVSDCIGDVYEDQGHIFAVFTFPTADVTWVYDATTSAKMGRPMWHQRLSYTSSTGTYHRHRGNCYVNFADIILCGDYQTGQIHQQSRQFYTDAGNVLRAQRRTPHVWSPQNRKRIFASSLQVEFTPGVGLQTGQGSSPQCMIRWSNDGGQNWSNEHWVTIGKAGRTKNRAILRRLGESRDRVWEINYSDPTARDIIGATLFGEGEEEIAA